MSISAKMFGSAKMPEEFEPLRKRKDIIVTAMIATAAVLFVGGLWGIATFKIKNRIFVSIFGLLAGCMACILGGLSAILYSLANVSDK